MIDSPSLLGAEKPDFFHHQRCIFFGKGPKRTENCQWVLTGDTLPETNQRRKQAESLGGWWLDDMPGFFGFPGGANVSLGRIRVY